MVIKMTLPKEDAFQYASLLIIDIHIPFLKDWLFEGFIEIKYSCQIIAYAQQYFGLSNKQFNLCNQRNVSNMSLYN